MQTVSSVPGYLTINEAAEFLGIDPSQVRRYCLGDAQAKLPAIKVGNLWLIKKSDLYKFHKPRVGNPTFKKSD
jgi:excisionase family DNA binding protein